MTWAAYLLEWLHPSPQTANSGLAEYVDDAIPSAINAVSEETGNSKPVLMGHSLGGTLAAHSAALYPRRLSGLVLLCAPVCFQPGTSSFRDSLAAIIPSWSLEADTIPGSLLSQLSAASAPRAFVWSRLADALASAGDPQATDIRSRVERWALDEVPLSGPFFRDIFVRLYQENQFCIGKLVIRGKRVQPAQLHIPVLAVANVADEVAPPGSIKPFLGAAGEADTHLIEHPGEVGVVLQHLAVLVGRDALAHVWPEIVRWIKDHINRRSEIPVQT